MSLMDLDGKDIAKAEAVQKRRNVRSKEVEKKKQNPGVKPFGNASGELRRLGREGRGSL
ncbi:MAG: hypothetical protein LBT40_13705 [Deltaproteobacteria bacterium]|nr:hypothetical protein [Deltaproteobacteria bacterium]